MKCAAIIVSAGRGHRFMKGQKKQFLPLAGKPVLAHALDPFEGCPLIHSIHLVVGQEDMDYCLREIVEKYAYRKISQIVPGGKLRQDSVRSGIESLAREIDIVLIHDGVRPFVSQGMIEESIHEAKLHKAAVVAVPVKDTIKRASRDRRVLETLDRESLWQVQTPQTFQADVIREAFLRAAEDGFVGTDDASLVERLGIKVRLVPGSYTNIKITTPEDFLLANLLMETKMLSCGQTAVTGKGLSGSREKE